MEKIDLSHLVNKTKPFCIFIPYNKKPYDNTNDSIKLILIVSRFGHDHALHYLFITNNPTIEQIENFARDNYDCWGDDYVVIETGETFKTNKEVDAKAIFIKKILNNANVYTPALTLK